MKQKREKVALKRSWNYYSTILIESSSEVNSDKLWSVCVVSLQIFKRNGLRGKVCQSWSWFHVLLKESKLHSITIHSNPNIIINCVYMISTKIFYSNQSNKTGTDKRLRGISLFLKRFGIVPSFERVIFGLEFLVLVIELKSKTGNRTLYFVTKN